MHTYTRVGSRLCVMDVASNLWILDLDTMGWRKLVSPPTPTLLGRVLGRSKPWPEPRTFPLLVSVRGCLVVFGGYWRQETWTRKGTSDRRLRDCWAFDLETDIWTRLPDTPVHFDQFSVDVPVTHDQTLLIVSKENCGRYGVLSTLPEGPSSLEGGYSLMYSFSLDTGLVPCHRWELHIPVRDLALVRLFGRHLLVAATDDVGGMQCIALDTVSMTWKRCIESRRDRQWGLHD
ncbi:hypothetical protein KIPB_008926 [Kipferlia bialata]|uniref:Kelch-type beta propeller n=1 Tax=Kipferlia bialata TaxID=797122 RepID=A0A9K3D2R6_9EUKA|nr:hypothetical protein KIPB_008926 [Kipferlia bialata]|eukprot:g8926.t1